MDVTERVVNSIVSEPVEKNDQEQRYSEVMREPLVIFAVERKQSR